MARLKAPFTTCGGDFMPAGVGLPGEGASFAGLFDRFWDSLIDDGATAREVDRIEQQLALFPGARIAVAPSGSARLALALAARGYDVIGIDRSPDAIERSRALASCAGLDVSFSHCDALSLEAAGARDAVLCFGHGLAPALLAVRLAAALKTGGCALVDVDDEAALSAGPARLAAPGLEIVGRVAGLGDGGPHAPGRQLLLRRCG